MGVQEMDAMELELIDGGHLSWSGFLIGAIGGTAIGASIGSAWGLPGALVGGVVGGGVIGTIGALS